MLTEKLSFHLSKWYRLLKYHLKYRINKWKVIDGIYLPVYLRYGYSVLRFIDDGSYECEELSIVKQRLSVDDIVLELGTGIGFISAYCAKRIGSERVNTFEANLLMKPVMLELFAKNNVYPNFTNAFLGNNSDHFIAQNNFLASSEKKPVKSGTNIEVPGLDLNEEINRIQPTYLIMDIEGNEYDVLKMINFQSISKVQFELHPDLLSPEQVSDIFKKLKEHQFVRDEEISNERNYFFERNSLPSLK